MESLKAKAFRADFEEKYNKDDQKAFINALLKGNVGKRILKDAIFDYSVEKMLEYFPDEKVKCLIRQSKDAQRFLLGMGYYDDDYFLFNNIWGSWFAEESPNRIKNVSVQGNNIIMLKEHDNFENLDSEKLEPFDFEKHIRKGDFCNILTSTTNGFFERWWLACDIIEEF